MDQADRERVLAGCLDEYHARRGRGETPRPDEFGVLAGEAYEEFAALLAAESRLDEAMAPPAAPAFPRPFGEYTLLRELGRGAMGVVFEAIHRSLSRKVALKVLRTGFDTDDVARQRFRRESRSAAQIRHDNIVEIYDAGEIDGQPYYSMALLEGRSLHELAKAGELPSHRDLARGIADVADALDVLHRAGIVHRDVKPSNIMVAPSGRMVLADFGLARSSAEKLTATGQALGTPLYMSPEQVMGRTSEVDGRSDVYGLGATLYEVVTGHPIFEAGEMVAILRLILKERPVAPSRLAPDVDGALENVILKAVEKRKEDRYATAGAMRDDLRACAVGGSVVGRPVSSVQHGLRRAKRFWPLAAAAAVLVSASVYAWTHRAATLSVRSYPAASAQVDGEDQGRTPFELSLSSGDHRLLLRAEGFRDLDRQVHLAAGAALALEPMLPPEDAEDPKALAALAREFEVAMVDIAPASRTRAGGGVDDVLPLLPRGALRAEDLAEWSVEVGPGIEPGGRIEFRSGGRTLSSESFEPPEIGVARGPVPRAVADALAAGAEVEWGFHPAKGKPVVATMRKGSTAADVKLVRITKACGDRADVRRLLCAQCLLDAKLDVAAYREAAAHVAEHPESERGWAVMVESLRRMGLEKSELFEKASEGLDAVPQAQRGRAVIVR